MALAHSPMAHTPGPKAVVAGRSVAGPSLPWAGAPRGARLVRRVAEKEDGNLTEGSLVGITLDEMENDLELKETMERLKKHGQAKLTREEARKRQRSLDDMGVPSFGRMLVDADVSEMKRKATTILQLNIGLYCNQACTHCHVESSPLRKEAMDHETAARCLELAKACPTVGTLDITGGAPELHEEFRYLVTEARAAGLEVIDRCNLTVLLEPGQEDLVQFLADNKVRVVASLPCYSEDNVDAQRGRGVFERSIEGLKRLNAAGYGQEGTGLMLDLVYNPGGAFLAPPQETLTIAYKSELGDTWGIEFNSLFCLNNMPIKRFVDFLQRQDKLDDYMKLLVENFNPAAAEGVMCRDLISVGWDGRMFDCDFNQQLDIPLPAVHDYGPAAAGPTVHDVNSLEELVGAKIALGNHCFGCTAGAGSSCQGATS